MSIYSNHDHTFEFDTSSSMSIASSPGYIHHELSAFDNIFNSLTDDPDYHVHVGEDDFFEPAEDAVIVKEENVTSSESSAVPQTVQQYMINGVPFATPPSTSDESPPSTLPTTKPTFKRAPLRRKAHGDESYKELCIRAIRSSKDGRRTLHQVYEWMCANVPHLRGQEDVKSLVGWKNSVRHNLSLHACFVKVANDDPQASAWWMYDPSATGIKTKTKRHLAKRQRTVEKQKEPVAPFVIQEPVEAHVPTYSPEPATPQQWQYPNPMEMPNQQQHFQQLQQLQNLYQLQLNQQAAVYQQVQLQQQAHQQAHAQQQAQQTEQHYQLQQTQLPPNPYWGYYPNHMQPYMPGYGSY